MKRTIALKLLYRHTQASVWEHKAVLSDAQLQAIDAIADKCSQRPLPDHVSILDAAETQ